MKLLTLFSAVVAVVLFILGWQLDHFTQVTQQQLFWTIHGVGLTGTALALVFLMPRLPGPLLKVALAVGVFLAWRISYFPFMVFSGHIASIVEWVLVAVPNAPVWVFPTYFVALAGLNAFVAGV
ncbi:MAG: hypothetical protein KTR14_01230, partial [Vampirovibrio sp.]|nr:hypothetical protein [Vampirovibrio sp.]